MLELSRISARLLAASLAAILACTLQAEDSSWLYAVQISASVQVSPPRITLNWEPDLYTVDSLALYRKSKDDTSWGTGTALLPSSITFTDTEVAVGATYEYQIVKQAHGDVAY